MRLLLDTHAFIWWFAGSEQLPQSARRLIEADDNDVLISAASAWEIATKHRKGKLPEADPLVRDMTGAIADQDFEELSVTVDDAARAGALPGPLRDPFDRMLIAQALSRNLVLISNESLFDRYDVRRLW
ncbi:MAG: type II toxin-antitoxin system VapC family toxin [Dehalococcoidia bacterium]|nr:type II toxin-antitoxin system VapC family toxin [Dehalococcoidia bacterium]